MKRWISVNEASRYLRMNIMSVYRGVQTKQIPAVKIGGSWRIDSTKLTFHNNG